jgi:hypothetical protein
MNILVKKLSYINRIYLFYMRPPSSSPLPAGERDGVRGDSVDCNRILCICISTLNTDFKCLKYYSNCSFPAPSSTNINMPEPAHYPGKQYFSPFALGVLSILKKLAKGD